MPKSKWMKELLEVHWHDACTTSLWRSRKDYLELAEPVHCRTVGYLLKKTKRSLTLIMTQGNNDDINGSMTIPRDWIQKITTLR